MNCGFSGLDSMWGPATTPATSLRIPARIRNSIPRDRVGDPDDIARAVLFLCDERNSFITGANLTIDGGMTRRMIYDGDEGWRYRP